MFSFFRTTEVFAFAESIGEEYDRLRRSSALRDDNANKRREKFAKLAQRVEAYSREQKLNFYKKAKLLFGIKQNLNRHAVPEQEITEFLRLVLGRSLG